MSETDNIDDIPPADCAEVFAYPPIPEGELAKGNTITADRLEELGAMSGDRVSAKWAFRLLRLRDEIQSIHKVSVRILRGGLHINTDAEASEYHNGRGEGGLQMIKRQVNSMHKLVDASKLSPAEQARHDRSLCVWGARMAGLKRAVKALESTTAIRIEQTESPTHPTAPPDRSKENDE